MRWRMRWRRGKKVGGYFKIETEEFGALTSRYLDVELSIVGNYVNAVPAWKPTSLMRPLEPTSAHAPSVHLSRPVWMLRNTVHLSSIEM